MINLEEVMVIHAPIERCFDLARSVEVHLAGNVHFGEAAVATAGVTSGLIGLGQRVTWRAKHFGAWHNLTSEVTVMDRPVFFQDAMLRGPFKSMKHDHFFRQMSRDSVEMRDVFCFEAPIPVLGRIGEITLLGRYMRKLLRERNNVLREIAESAEWQKYL